MEIITICDGFGTRIQSISNGIPKALMRLGHSVFLDINSNNKDLVEAGCKFITLKQLEKE